MTAPVVILQQFHTSVSQIWSLQNFKQNLYDQEREIFTNSASLCSPSVKHDITCRNGRVTRGDRVVQTSPLFTFNKTNTFRLLKNVLRKLKWPIQVIINSLWKCNIWFSYLQTALLQCRYLLCGCIQELLCFLPVLCGCSELTCLSTKELDLKMTNHPNTTNLPR